MHHLGTVNGTHFNYNGDLDGMVEISFADPADITYVPAEDLIQLVINHLINKRIGQLQSLTIEEIVKDPSLL